MYDNDYLEKILGEQYNMSNYFEDTYTQPVVNIIDTSVEGDGTLQVSTKAKKEKTASASDKTTREVSSKPISVSEKSELEVSTKPASESEKKEIEVSDKTISNTEISEIKVSAEPAKEISTEPAIQQPIKVSIPVIDSSNVKEVSANSNVDENQTIAVNTKPEVKEYINVSNMYPEIYNAIEPIVELVVHNNIEKEINDDLIENMTNKIYYAVEADSEPKTLQVSTSPINNNDIIPASARPRNHMLHDLIKILILNNILSSRHQRPNPPHHHHHNISYHGVPFPEDA